LVFHVYIFKYTTKHGESHEITKTRGQDGGAKLIIEKEGKSDGSVTNKSGLNLNLSLFACLFYLYDTETKNNDVRVARTLLKENFLTRKSSISHQARTLLKKLIW
jgi:hypothetical protein